MIALTVLDVESLTVLSLMRDVLRSDALSPEDRAELVMHQQIILGLLPPDLMPCGSFLSGVTEQTLTADQRLIVDTIEGL